MKLVLHKLCSATTPMGVSTANANRDTVANVVQVTKMSTPCSSIRLEQTALTFYVCVTLCFAALPVLYIPKL